MSRASRAACLAVLSAGALACAGQRTAGVTPADIPQLEAAVAARPDDGATVLRLAAALLAANLCDSALTVARRGMEMRPRDALGPLVAGQCLERRGDEVQAVALYEGFSTRYGNSIGAPAVAARALLARRSLARASARDALAREAELSAVPPDANVVAVLPLDIIGDSAYRPLSAGLAQILTSDLALIRRLRLVERSQLHALLQEIALNATTAVDPATAARAGRLLRAGTLVQGVALVPPDERIRLEVSLVGANAEVIGRESVTGELRDVLDLEKDLVIGLASAAGYELSTVERQAILANGTRNLAAFLAFSQGVIDQAAGDYAAAAAHFGRAVRTDPGFQQAREEYRASAAVGAVQDAGAGLAPTSLADTRVVDPASPTGSESAEGTVSGGVTDVAGTTGERLGGGSGSREATESATSKPPPSTTGTGTKTVTFPFGVVVRIP